MPAIGIQVPVTLMTQKGWIACLLDVMVVDKMRDLFGIPVEKTLMTQKACVRGIMEIMIMSMSAAGTLAVTKIYSRLLA